MTTPVRIRSKTRRGRDAEEGAVMLVVLLIILMVTATAMFAVHSTMFELRAAGAQRQAMQTQALSEGSLTTALAMIDDGYGADAVDTGMRTVLVPAGTQWAAEEPAYGATTAHFRAYMADFATMRGVVAQPIETTAHGGSFGTALGYTPDFVIDINDSYDPGLPIPGMSSTGDSPVAYRVWTVTARGRTAPAPDTYAPADMSSPAAISRSIHQTAMNSRAVVISGPIYRR